MPRARNYSVLFWVALLVLSIFYTIALFHRAANKTFWQDEQFAFGGTVRPQPMLRLLIEGGSGQASPAPLDYVLLKGLDAIRVPVRYFGLTPAVYYRLAAYLATMLTAWLIAFLAWRSLLRDRDLVSPLQLVLIFFAIWAYFFSATTYHYSIEMRPYSLWNNLWFLLGAVLLYHPRRIGVIFLILVSMALTASGAVFQFVALGLAFLIMRTIQGESWKQVLPQTLLLLLPPFFLGLFYSLKSGNLGISLEGQSWGYFLKYMVTNEHVPVFTALGIFLCSLRRDTWKFAFPAVALLVLYLMGPALFWATRSRGMFHADRQYIYYATAIPFFFLIASKVYPVLRDRFPAGRKWMMVAGFAFLMIGSQLVYFQRWTSAAVEHYRWDERFGFFREPQRELTTLLETEIPDGFCADLEEHRQDVVFGLELLAEWIPIRYPELKSGGKTVFLKSDAGVPFVADIAAWPCIEGKFVNVGLES
jgi:hypothetical protein